ncbi:hypothetical protein [Halorientalis salina]|uniref:hypothetical protein n=1 Tax=Halorientalis salina TaxID=2932266 RepID=UPI0010AD73BB|nr:hypothetical protein [Halorientalis salina]
MSGELVGAVDRAHRSGVALSLYFRRLLTPPLPGDGLLLFGFLEGVLGWGLSWLFSQNPGLAPIGLIPSIVLTWVVLTGGVVFVGVTYTAPTVRRNRVWMVWGGLNVTATGVNLAALAGTLPSGLVTYAYWHPWLAVMGIGYLVTGLYNWGNPQIRRQERLVYVATGLVTLGLLVASFGPLTGFVTGNVFLLGGVLQLVPIGHDVLADAVLIARRQ